MTKPPRKNLVKSKPPVVRGKRPKQGDYFQIELGAGLLAYGRVLQSPIYAFYNVITTTPLTTSELDRKALLCKICVMKYAWKKTNWKIIGYSELPIELCQRVWFAKQDSISGELTMYSEWEGKVAEKKATRKQLLGLECAAVWDPDHVEDRLRDHYNGVENKWVKNLALK